MESASHPTETTRGVSQANEAAASTTLLRFRPAVRSECRSCPAPGEWHTCLVRSAPLRRHVRGGQRVPDITALFESKPRAGYGHTGKRTHAVSRSGPSSSQAPLLSSPLVLSERGDERGNEPHSPAGMPPGVFLGSKRGLDSSPTTFGMSEVALVRKSGLVRDGGGERGVA
jgi:hypothetical protein